MKQVGTGLLKIMIVPFLVVYALGALPAKWTTSLIHRPTALLSLLVTQILAIAGMIWMMISLGCSIWQILLGTSAVFALVGALHFWLSEQTSS